MKSINKVILVGRLGRDPDLRYTEGGTAYARFSLATDTWQKDKPPTTEWHNVVVWDKLAEAVGEHLKKGQMAYVEGSIQSRKYEKDGVERVSFEVRARDVVFLSAPKSAETTTEEIPF